MAVTPRGFFCDDIRTEMNGKYLLIGLYPGSLITYFPNAFVTLATFVEIDGLALGAHEVSLSVRYTGDGFDNQIGDVKLNVTIVDDTMPAYVIPNGLTLHATHNGRLKLFVGIDGNDAMECCNIKVTVPDVNPEPSLP